MFVKDPNEAKCQYLIKKRENVGLKNWDNTNAFIDYSNIMDEIYVNIQEYNANKKRKLFIVLSDMIADMLNNEKRQQTVTVLFIGVEI